MPLVEVSHNIQELNPSRNQSHDDFETLDGIEMISGLEGVKNSVNPTIREVSGGMQKPYWFSTLQLCRSSYSNSIRFNSIDFSTIAARTK
jgi:hypothetical protein